MRLRTLLMTLAATCALAGPSFAQSNDDDFTPLNSRIARDRQFPLNVKNPWVGQMTSVVRERSRRMENLFSRCIYNRSHEDSLALLQKTDFGFEAFEQIGLDNERAMRNHGFMDCLRRVASSNGTGVQMRFTAAAVRQWLIREAYFDRYEGGPTWVQSGLSIAPRQYPLSGEAATVRAFMDFADCAVAADPFTADFYYRTAEGSEGERAALQALVPALGPCLPNGVKMEIHPALLRIWLGEALWHAANHGTPAPAAEGSN